MHSIRQQPQLGQAMTEMLVACAFVVVPLFLIVPTVGKYIDMKHAAVNAARYVSWERTVYFNADTLDNEPSGFTAFSHNQLPKKSDSQLAQEASSRIFTDASTRITSSSLNPGRSSWKYYDASEMYQPPQSERPSLSSNGQVPDKSMGIVRTLMQGFGTVVSTITGILPFSSSQFDAISTRGNTQVDVNMSVAQIPNYNNLHGDDSGLLQLGPNGLTMTAQAGVLSQTWGAAGPDHMKSQAQALAPTKLIGDLFNLIKIPGIGSGQNLIASALLTPEFTDENLVFGQMDENALPRDKYESPEFPDADDEDSPLCNDQGYCRE